MPSHLGLASRFQVYRVRTVDLREATETRREVFGSWTVGGISLSESWSCDTFCRGDAPPGHLENCVGDRVDSSTDHGPYAGLVAKTSPSSKHLRRFVRTDRFSMIKPDGDGEFWVLGTLDRPRDIKCARLESPHGATEWATAGRTFCLEVKVVDPLLRSYDPSNSSAVWSEVGCGSFPSTASAWTAGYAYLRASAPPPPPPFCTETCKYASDGECDDGGDGAEFFSCGYGSDCTDWQACEADRSG